MALNKCPECERDVSTKAYACPQCGHPFRRKTTVANRNRGLGDIVLFGVPLVIAFLVWLYVESVYDSLGH